ncbi:uncharacterized protein [Zea mays]|uniref:uncharacterized protein isoform X2 n=1 Tax=Zea mays TaxID=4577 RepID=UPI0004DE8989|nr:uncharacterized protein LOC100280017 isoform X2 [Zea mays]|eukprot:XP_008647738.1 uncharacterized protein LOC100280017 isoform X2 [Zea mays]
MSHSLLRGSRCLLFLLRCPTIDELGCFSKSSSLAISSLTLQGGELYELALVACHPTSSLHLVFGSLQSDCAVWQDNLEDSSPNEFSERGVSATAPHHRVAAMPPPRRKRKAASYEPRRRSPSRLEFRATVDGAWYEARVAVQCGALRVMYEEFLEEQDEWYDPAGLATSSAWDVVKLRARFRVPSTPLEDTQCRDLQAGARLCVSCSLDGGDLKFYDAILDSVYPAAHEIVDGMERCACRFAVQWSDGPRAGSMEEVGIERVCCVQSSPVQDPVLMEFLDGVTKLAGDANVETVSQEIHVAPVVKGGVPANALQTRHRDFNGKFGPASRQAV